ncbi:MAG: MFS transporter [Nitriliruptoraceae bacterium]|nr:MFS transporter [Nitriliruptoraceae bacterium]
MRAYRDLFAHPRARWPLLSSMVARLTQGMIIIAIVYLLRRESYSFTAAGIVTAAHQVGLGVGAPIQGRLVDRFGQVRVLVPDALVYLLGTIAIAVLAASGAAVGAIAVVAACAGAVLPPVGPCSRVLMSSLFPTGRMRETAFAVTSIAVELGYVIGPLIAIGIAEAIRPDLAVVAAGVFAAVGTLGYASTSSARRFVVTAPVGPRVSALRVPGLRLLMAAFGAIAVVFGALDVVVPAVAELIARPSDAGWLLACIAAGSVVGGLVYGGRVWSGTPVSRLRRVIVALAVGMFLLPVATASVPAFAVTLALAGVFLAPTTIIAFQLIDDLAIRGTQTEAQAWTQTAVVIGVAIGAALSGAAVDLVGPAASFLAAAGSVSVGAIVILAGSRWLETETTPADQGDRPPTA